MWDLGGCWCELGLVVGNMIEPALPEKLVHAGLPTPKARASKIAMVIANKALEVREQPISFSLGIGPGQVNPKARHSLSAARGSEKAGADSISRGKDEATRRYVQSVHERKKLVSIVLLGIELILRVQNGDRSATFSNNDVGFHLIFSDIREET